MDLEPVVELGPYRFTAGDVEATLRHGDDLLALLTADVDPSISEPLLSNLAPWRDPTGSDERSLTTLWAQLADLPAAVRAQHGYGLAEVAPGTVVQLNRSDGGVPKTPVDRMTIGFGGVVGDRQATRKHHGRPWQAVCLWSAEVIDGFAAAGHPTGYGSAGENVTIRGLPWSAVRPGVRLTIGTAVCAVSSYAVPCFQNARWFTGGRFGLMHHRRGPVSRIYATVIEPGEVTVGDLVHADG